MNDLIKVHAINATTGKHCCGEVGFWDSSDWTKVTCPDCIVAVRVQKYFVDMMGDSGRYALYMWEKLGMGVVITKVAESWSSADLRQAARSLNQIANDANHKKGWKS